MAKSTCCQNVLDVVYNSLGRCGDCVHFDDGGSTKTCTRFNVAKRDDGFCDEFVERSPVKYREE